VQARGFNPPLYRIVSTRGPEHAKVFEVEVLVDGRSYGRGAGRSKQSAAKAAAQQALETFEYE